MRDEAGETQNLTCTANLPAARHARGQRALCSARKTRCRETCYAQPGIVDLKRNMDGAVSACSRSVSLIPRPTYGTTGSRLGQKSYAEAVETFHAAVDLDAD